MHPLPRSRALLDFWALRAGGTGGGGLMNQLIKIMGAIGSMGLADDNLGSETDMVVR